MLINDQYRHGEGKMMYANKDVYDGRWSNNLRKYTGEMFYFIDKSKYLGEWNNDTWFGQGRLQFANGEAVDKMWGYSY